MTESRADLLAALDAEAFAGSRLPDTPELQAERRRVLCEAMGPDMTVCPVCGKALALDRRSSVVGRHYWGFRRCSGSGLPVTVRLVPVPTFKEI